MKNQSDRLKGFTFIELLVVIALIGIISTVIMVRLNQASSSSRDKKRFVDLRTIQAALTLYNSDWDAYPTSLEFGSSLTAGGRTYLQEIPKDPSAPTREYYYTSNGSNYTLCAAVERANNIPSAGDSHYPPATYQCGSVDCNYCLKGY